MICDQSNTEVIAFPFTVVKGGHRHPSTALVGRESPRGTTLTAYTKSADMTPQIQPLW